MSSRDKTTVAQEITELLAEHYDFEIPFSLLTADEYREDAHNLPEWWNEDMPRLDAMFFTIDADRDALAAELETLDVPDEVLHIEPAPSTSVTTARPIIRKRSTASLCRRKPSRTS